MTVINIISLSELGGTTGRRLDAEFYDPESVKLENALRSIPHTTFNKMRIKVDGSAFYPSIAEHYQDSGIPFLRVSDISEGSLKETDIFLPPQIADKFSSIRKGYPGDIVITKGGTVGTVALLPDKFPQYALSRDLILIKTSVLPNEQAISIVLFLMSKYGKFQLMRGKSQQVQPHLTLPLIKGLSLPYLNAEDAAKSYKDSLSKFQESNRLYFQAENLLIEGLGLKDFKPKYELSYTANLHGTLSAHRTDAEFFQPAYEILKRYIIRNGYYVIRELEKFNKRGVQPAYIEDGEVEVLTSKHLGRTSIDYENLEKTSLEEWTQAPDAQIKTFDILTYTTGAYVGRTNCFLEETKALASNHVNLLRIKQLNPVYAAVFLNSIFGQMQVKKFVSGSAQSELYPSNMSRFVIWKAPDKIQQRIALLVQESFKARKEGKVLLEEAKRKVEQKIKDK